MSFLNAVFVAVTLLGSSHAKNGELELRGDAADDVCKVYTLIESVSCIDAFISQNTVLSIPDSSIVNVEIAPTKLYTCVTITTTLNPPTTPPVIEPLTQFVVPQPPQTEVVEITTLTTDTLTTFCPSPTTFTHGTQTYTVTEATTLTITDCPCTYTRPITRTIVPPPAFQTTGAFYYTTITTDIFTTVCPSPTTFTHGTNTYTITEPSTITITDCPCTLTHSFPSFPPFSPSTGFPSSPGVVPTEPSPPGPGETTPVVIPPGGSTPGGAPSGTTPSPVPAPTCSSTPPPAPTVPGTTECCTEWYVIVERATCGYIELKFNITYAEFQALNHALDDNCTNLEIGLAYCVSGQIEVCPGCPPCQGCPPLPSTSSIASLPSQSVPVSPPDLSSKSVPVPLEETTTPVSLATSSITSLPSESVPVPPGETTTPVSPSVPTTTATTGLAPSQTCSSVAPPAPTAPGTTECCMSYHIVVEGDTCASIADLANITTTEFDALNHDLLPDCSNLLVSAAYCIHGQIEVCPDCPPCQGCPPLPSSSSIAVFPSPSVSTSGEVVPPASMTTSAPSVPSATSCVPIPPPTYVTPGTTSDCCEYYIVETGDNCGTIETRFGITFAEFQALNPNLDANCYDLLVGIVYCVKGTPPPSSSIVTLTKSLITSMSTTISKAPSCAMTGALSAIMGLGEPTADEYCNSYLAVAPPVSTPFVTATSIPIVPGSSIVSPTPGAIISTTVTSVPSCVPSPPSLTRNGTTGTCCEWHVVVAGDTCSGLESTYDLTFVEFQALNPDVFCDCLNLLQQFSYCVRGLPSMVLPSDPCQAGPASTTTLSLQSSIPSQPASPPICGPDGGNGICATGCCSSYGFCGTTPEYCGTGCFPANSESGACAIRSSLPPSGIATSTAVPAMPSSTHVPTPPDCGLQAGGATCPLGECCSGFGYCGTGDRYCGAGCQSGGCLPPSSTSSIFGSTSVTASASISSVGPPIPSINYSASEISSACSCVLGLETPAPTGLIDPTFITEISVSMANPTGFMTPPDTVALPNCSNPGKCGTFSSHICGGSCSDVNDDDGGICISDSTGLGWCISKYSVCGPSCDTNSDCPSGVCLLDSCCGNTCFSTSNQDLCEDEMAPLKLFRRREGKSVFHGDVPVGEK